MESLAEEFQRKMDLSDKSFTSSLELSSKEGTMGKPNNGILVEEVQDPYQFLEDSSDDDNADLDGDIAGNSSGRQMSTSDLMQTDADAVADPCTIGGDASREDGGGSGLDGYYKHRQQQYLQTSDISDYKFDS